MLAAASTFLGAGTKAQSPEVLEHSGSLRRLHCERRRFAQEDDRGDGNRCARAGTGGVETHEDPVRAVGGHEKPFGQFPRIDIGSNAKQRRAGNCLAGRRSAADQVLAEHPMTATLKSEGERRFPISTRGGEDYCSRSDLNRRGMQ